MSLQTINTSVLGKLAVTTNVSGVSSLALLKDPTPADILLNDVYTSTYTRYFFVNNGVTTYSGYVRPSDAARYISLNDPLLKDYSSKVTTDGNFNFFKVADCSANNTFVFVTQRDIDKFGQLTEWTEIAESMFNESTAIRHDVEVSIGLSTKTAHPTASKVHKFNGQLGMETTSFDSPTQTLDSQRGIYLILNHLNFNELFDI